MTKTCPHCKKEIPLTSHDAAVVMGSRVTDKKSEAARENGKKGGRPIGSKTKKPGD